MSELAFTLGEEYTRAEIHSVLGGSKVSCLPTIEGRIVAACLSKAFSPQAPEIVLCGQGVRTGPVSELLAGMRCALPVFIKAAANRWQYRGVFVVKHTYRSGPRFESLINGSGRSAASVSYVVLLQHLQ